MTEYNQDYPQVNLIRKFDSGATRSADGNKPDPEGFLSPAALSFYCDYMHKHRKQLDGSLRASDNWQQGIPQKQYMKSLWRHLLQVWRLHREYEVHDWDTGAPVTLEEALCGVIFNAHGMLHEQVKQLEQPK